MNNYSSVPRRLMYTALCVIGLSTQSEAVLIMGGGLGTGVHQRHQVKSGEGPLAILGSYGLDASYIDKLRALNPHAFPEKPVDNNGDGLEDLMFAEDTDGSPIVLTIPPQRHQYFGILPPKK